jgi:hypothetical protein
MGESVTWLVNDIALRSDPKAPQPGLPEWTGNADEMLLFDFDNRDNTFVLVTHPTTCQRYNAGGRPDPPYFEYRVRNGKWQQVRFSESLVGREANMHVWPDPTGQPAFVDLSAKQKLQNKLRPQQRRLVASGRYGDC